MRVLVALSGGVDSSVAAALLLEEGHEVVGATMRLWGGESDTGCCSVADVDDARRVAQQLGIAHHVFGLSHDFEARVVAPYVADHAAGRTPNPCVECNRHLKFDRLLVRARLLGFDAVATGHHARVVDGPGGPRLARGADRAKDQSYVLHVLDPAVLGLVRFPVGELTKAEVRARAAALGLRTAAKPDSQDVCFVTSTGGRRVGTVAAVELVTVGQRRGLGLPGGGPPRYVLDVDPSTATVTVGDAADLLVDGQPLAGLAWAGGPVEGEVLAQCSAHGDAVPATVDGDVLRWARPHRRVAPGQSVVLYDGDVVVGGAVAA
ncbi:MAG TPA: tRNA 2-thiouridine(34) synthase MnmA [Acidimicrobiales bacterium]